MRLKVGLSCVVMAAILSISFRAGRGANPPSKALRITTWQNDNAHTGQNLAETMLTPLNVNSTSFGKLGSYPVDGQIYAQPLYWQGLHITKAGSRGLLNVKKVWRRDRGQNQHFFTPTMPPTFQASSTTAGRWESATRPGRPRSIKFRRSLIAKFTWERRPNSMCMA
jgi:hypothetical protein